MERKSDHHRADMKEDKSEINWAEIEKQCGKHPNGTVIASAWWASRVENYLRMKRMEAENKDPFEPWDKLIRESFLSALEAAKEIQPNTPQWSFIWDLLSYFKLYAERKYKESE